MRRNLAGEEGVQRRLVLRLQRLERQLRLGEKFQRAGIDERGRRAWGDQRHRHAEMLVDALQLAEIGELVRAGDVADRREERVLHDRPQQHVRAEAGGILGGLLHQRGGAVRVLADEKLSVPLANRLTAAVQHEQRDRVVLRLDLRMVAASLQVCARPRRRASPFRQAWRAPWRRRRRPAASHPDLTRRRR